MSLSPRPERLTMKTLALRGGRAPDRFGDGVRRFERGMMPSVRESSARRVQRFGVAMPTRTRRGPDRAARRARGRSSRNRARPRPSVSARSGRRRPAARSCTRPAARRARRRDNAPRARRAASPRPPASTPISFTLASREERVEDADGVAAAADAGDHRIGQAAFGFENLRRASSPITVGNRAPSSGTDASRAPSRAGSGCRRRW